jgi:hypothetical protein
MELLRSSNDKRSYHKFRRNSTRSNMRKGTRGVDEESRKIDKHSTRTWRGVHKDLKRGVNKAFDKRGLRGVDSG